MKKGNFFQSRVFICILSFLLPFLMFLLLCAALEVCPFGPVTLLDMDAPGQYIRIFSAVHELASGKTDFFYTFSKSLGGDMVSILAYYLLSPLNLIFLLFPKELFPLAMTLVIGLKLALCGLFMSLFLMGSGRRSLMVPVFAAAYAFTAYNIVYTGNLIWLDGVYLLPLVALGLSKLFEGKSPLLYILSLAFALFTNYYIGYMLCIFSVSVFAAGVLLRLCEKKPVLRLSAHYAVSSLLSGMLAAVLLVPCFMALSGTKAGIDGGRLGMFLMYPFEDMLSMLLPRSFQTDEMLTGLPFFYCGTVSLVCALLYFANGGIPLKQRAVAFLFAAALLVSFNVNGLYVIWHGMSYPTGFPYRNAFIFSFVLIWLGWQGWCRREGLSLRAFGVSVLIMTAVFVFIRPFSRDFLDSSAAVLGIGSAVLVLGLIFAQCRLPGKKLAALALALVQLALLFDNALFIKKRFVMYFDSQDYAAELKEAKESVDYIEALDGGFYRMANTQGGQNEPIQLGYNGIAHFSSSEKTQVKRFLHALGLSSYSDYWVWYQDGATAALDTLLGLKYLISPQSPARGYEHIRQGAALSIYENPFCLGMAFPASADALSSVEGADVFSRQNGAFTALSGEDAAILLPAENLETELENFTASAEGEAPLYSPIDPAIPAAVHYRFTAEYDAPLYIYCDAAGDREAEIIVNGKSLGPILGIYDHRVICLGSFEKGDELCVSIVSSAGPLALKESYIYYEDEAALGAVCQRLSSIGSGELEKLSSSHLRWQGDVVADDSLLFLSIPYEKGWRAAVDGEDAVIEPALSVLSAVRLDPGRHTVELRYTPPGFCAGLAISLAAVLFLGLWLILIRRQKSK